MKDQRLRNYLAEKTCLEIEIARELVSLANRDAFNRLLFMVDFTSGGIDVGFLPTEYGELPRLELYRRYLNDLRSTRRSSPESVPQ